MIQAHRLGWMAGIIDLKGRLINKVNKDRATSQVVLMAESQELAIIRELGSLTGTRPEMRKAMPLKDFMRKGCGEHCPEPHVHVNEWGRDGQIAPVARWTITGAGMFVVLDTLLPLLQVDRGYEQAMDVVRSNVVLGGQGSGMVYSSLLRLETLGWPMPEEFKAAVQLRRKTTLEDDLPDEEDPE